MLKLIKCEFLKLKRKPLVFISLLLSVFMPLAYAVFLADVNTDVDAVNGVMSSPVSYTHLDVYKRQGYRCDEIILANSLAVWADRLPDRLSSKSITAEKIATACRCV